MNDNGNWWVWQLDQRRPAGERAAAIDRHLAAAVQLHRLRRRRHRAARLRRRAEILLRHARTLDQRPRAVG